MPRGAIVLTILLMSPLLAQQENGMLEGIVSDTVSNSGLEGVRVTVEVAIQTHDVPMASLQTATDASGRFRLTGLKSGDYWATFQRDGFILSPTDGPARMPFRLDSSHQRISLQAVLAPYALLRGRIIDSRGKPVGRARVEINTFRRGHSSSTTSDANGLFVVDHLSPGRYMLLARPAEDLRLAQDRSRTRQAPTYFPGSTDREQAEPIVIRAGAELSGYEIRLRTVAVYGVHGTVLHDDGTPAAGVSIALVAPNGWDLPEAQVTSKSDGAFEFPAVRQGEWRFLARDSGGEKGFTSTVIRQTDIDNLELRLARPFTLHGFVERDEPRDSPGTIGLSAVYLLPVDGPTEQQVMAFHHPDGTLQIDDVSPGRYRVQPVGFVSGYYLQSVFLGDREVTGEPVDLMSGSLSLRIVYKSNAGRVRGNVDKGEGATVVLLPADAAFLNDQFIRTAQCESYGRFEINSLRPGDYLAFAFDRVDRDALEDPVFVQGIANRGRTVHVEQGQLVSTELSRISWPE